MTTLVLVHHLDEIDGSHYQRDAGPLHLDLVRNIPTHAIAWKATQSISYVDPSFASVRAQIRRLDFEEGAVYYHWLSSTTDPVAQAHHYLRTMGDWADGEGAMLDAEEAGITVAQCLAWLETVEEVTRLPAVPYTGLYVAGGTIWRDPRIRMSKYGPRPMHLAAYVTATNLTARLQALGITHLPVHMWQWSSSGPVAGIVGRCDMSTIQDPAAFYSATHRPVVTPQPQPSPPSTTRKDDAMIVTNSQPRLNELDDQIYPTGKFVFVIEPGGVIRHVDGATAEGRCYQITPDTPAFTNPELDAWPKYSAPSVQPPSSSGPQTFDVAGSFTGLATH